MQAAWLSAVMANQDPAGPLPSFWLPLNDLGAGAVNLSPNIAAGSGTPTFTRATTATTFDVNATAPLLVGSGIARSYYDPVSHLYRGHLSEPQSTNLLLNSLINGTNLSTQSVTVTAQAYTLSFYGTGTVTLSGAATGAKVGTAAYPTRSTFTFTPTAGTLTLTVTGTVQYAQLEAGSSATSFIPTAGSAVTRNADVLNYPSAGNIGLAQGTVFAQYTPSGGHNPNSECVVTFSNGATYGVGNGLLLRADVSIAAFGGNSSSSNIPLTWTDGHPHKIAGTYNGIAATVYADGVAGSGINTMDFTGSGTTTINIGSLATGGTQNASGCIQGIKLFSRQLSDAQVAAL